MRRTIASILMAVIVYCGVTGMMGCAVAKASDNVEIEEVLDITENDDLDENMENDGTDGKKEKECIYNVSFPTDSRGFLDPENLSGKGQVFSDDFKVENYGNTDIAIKIKNIEIYYKSTEEAYEFSEAEVLDEHSYVKKLNVDVVWKNEQEKIEKVLNVLEGMPDEYVLFLKASEYDENGSFVRLGDGSVGSFYFTGTLSSNPDLVWEDGEVSVSFDYEIENIVENLKDDTGEIEPEEQGQPEEIGEENQAGDAGEGKENQPDATEEEKVSQTATDPKEGLPETADTKVEEEDKQ